MALVIRTNYILGGEAYRPQMGGGGELFYHQRKKEELSVKLSKSAFPVLLTTDTYF